MRHDSNDYAMRAALLCVFAAVLLPLCAARPKVGLALGGGGAKGAATIGALRVIEQAGIQIDMVAGTSIGAIIGGLYAAGYSTDELADMFLCQQWQDVIEGDRVETHLRSLLKVHGVETFADTRMPLRCVAADERDFSEVVLRSGPLAKAIRASMAVPYVYEPVAWGDRQLVDGGVINNLPVDIARSMGADIVIAIDLEQGSTFALGLPPKQIASIQGLAAWALARPDKKRREKAIIDTDVHIHPVLPDFTAASFGHDNCQMMMALGEEAARQQWEELCEIAVRQGKRQPNMNTNEKENILNRPRLSLDEWLDSHRHGRATR